MTAPQQVKYWDVVDFVGSMLIPLQEGREVQFTSQELKEVVKEVVRDREDLVDTWLLEKFVDDCTGIWTQHVEMNNL